MKKVVISLFTIVFLLPIAFTPADAASLKFNEKTTSLGTVPPKGYQLITESIKISQDGKNISYAAYKDNTHNFIFYNEKISPAFYAIKPGFPIFTSKKHHHAFIAYKKKDGGAVVVVDGKSSQDYDNVDELHFSANETRYAFRAVKNNEQCVVVDGQPGPWYTGIPVKNNMVFSPNSDHFAYVALKNNECVLVLDGKEQEHRFKLITDVTFSKGGKRIAYKGLIQGQLMNPGSQKWRVVVDGIPQNEYMKIFDLIFSPDTKQLAYAAVKNRKMVLVVDGKEKEPYDLYGLPVFSKDSKILAYSYRDKENFYFMLNNKKSGPFQDIGEFFFSQDSANYAVMIQKNNASSFIVNDNISLGYKKLATFKFSEDSSRYLYTAVRDDGLAQVVVDGKPGKAYWEVGEPYFSPDSKHVVHRIREKETNQFWTVMDGEKIDTAFNGIAKYFFSEDSRHLAYIAMKSLKKSVMVVDGKYQCDDYEFNIIGDPYFSPDSDHITYHVRAGDNKWKLVVDGHVLDGDYGGFIRGTPIAFDSNTHFSTIALREPGPEFLRIDVDIPETIKLESEIKSN